MDVTGSLAHETAKEMNNVPVNAMVREIAQAESTLEAIMSCVHHLRSAISAISFVSCHKAKLADQCHSSSVNPPLMERTASRLQSGFTLRSSPRWRWPLPDRMEDYASCSRLSSLESVSWLPG